MWHIHYKLLVLFVELKIKNLEIKAESIEKKERTLINKNVGHSFAALN